MWRKDDTKNDYLFVSQSEYPRRHRSASHMVLIFFIVVAFGYIGLRSASFFSAPELTIIEPIEGAQIAGNHVMVSGSTDPKTRITINNYEIFSEDDGSFSVSLPVQKGYHILDIRVENRIGNISKVVRQIVVE